MIVGRQAYSGIESSLQITFLGVHFHQFDQCFGAEFALETPLERFFGLFFMLQAQSKFSEDLPLFQTGYNRQVSH